MNNQRTEIHLALAFDENFITPFYVLLTSIFEKNKKNYIKLHVIATGVDDQEKKRIIEYVKLNEVEIFFYETDKFLKVNGFNFPVPKTTAYTIAIFYRLFFPLLVPENVKKILYIDVDTIVLDNLDELYSTDISPYPVGAALDKGMVIGSYPVLLEKIGIEKEKQFNSGVLLIDIKQWKQEKILEKSLQFIDDNQEILEFPDQVALNYALKYNYYILDNQYNFTHSDISINLSKKEVLKNKITILHYTSSKPWHFTNSARLRSIYYYYFKKTPYIHKKKYIDFTWTKRSFRGFIYIRILEFYLDHPWIRNTWKKIKS